VRRLCRRHRNCHRGGMRGTGDDAEASLSALLLPLTHTSIHRCRCHCHHTGKRGTGDDAKASSPALTLLSTRTSVCRCHCYRHRAGERGTGDDAEASSSALSPLFPICATPPTAFYCRLQPLLIVEYVTFILALAPPSPSIHPPNVCNCAFPTGNLFLSSCAVPTTCVVVGGHPNQAHAPSPMVWG
jgi:hypothetical protein